MVYQYNVKEERLILNIEPAKNRGTVFFTGVQIAEITNHKELSKGKTINLGTNDQLFIKFINKAEGFTIMLNNRHIKKSAGHPKKLLKRTRTPLKIGALIFTAQLIYVLFDLYQKNEFDASNFSAKTITYLAYFATLIVSILIGLQLARRGNWQGPTIGFTLILFNLLFSLGIGLYYNTGFNLFVRSFLTVHAFVLIMLFTHSAVIKYVRNYSKSLKGS
tara:strand:- start:487 stop:1143 length:657 start_codon:yes stop_codon:yes gene_type:complete